MGDFDSDAFDTEAFSPDAWDFDGFVDPDTPRQQAPAVAGQVARAGVAGQVERTGTWGY